MHRVFACLPGACYGLREFGSFVQNGSATCGRAMVETLQLGSFKHESLKACSKDLKPESLIQRLKEATGGKVGWELVNDSSA